MKDPGTRGSVFWSRARTQRARLALKLLVFEKALLLVARCWSLIFEQVPAGISPASKKLHVQSGGYGGETLAEIAGVNGGCFWARSCRLCFVVSNRGLITVRLDW